MPLENVDDVMANDKSVVGPVILKSDAILHVSSVTEVELSAPLRLMGFEEQDKADDTAEMHDTATSSTRARRSFWSG